MAKKSLNLEALLTPTQPANGVSKDAPQGRLPKILTIDIETSPNISYTWGLWQQNVSLSQLIQSSRVLCFAAKWHDEKKTTFYSEHELGHQAMIEAAWNLLNDADIVVSYNGPAFDIKHLQREFVQAGMTPPSPFKNVDLLRTARSQFKFPSNKLDYVGQVLGLGEKVKHAGFELWIKVMAGDDKAWQEMKKYNVQDVKLTEVLFDYLGPWIKGMPHIGLWTGQRCCSKCGGQDLRHDGFVHSGASVYARLQCQSCGAWNRATTREGKTEIKPL